MCDEVYKPVIQNLINNLRALREFVESVEPTIVERADSAEDSRYRLALALEYIYSRINPALCEGVEVPPELLGLEGKDVQVELVGEKNDAGKAEISFKVTGADADEFTKAVDLATSTKKLRHLRSLINQVQSDRKQMSILYRGALISLISQIQVFLGTLFEAQLRIRPDSLGDGESITLADLNSCGTVADAMEIILNRKVESMLHGGLDDWRVEIKRALGCELSHYADRFDEELTEVYQRRNLLVHSDGVVNALYLANVPATQKIGVKKGDQLEVDREYLDHAIDVFELAFVLLSLAAWKRNSRDDESRSTYAIDLEYDYLLERRWVIVEAIAAFTKDDPVLASELTNRVNWWLALKRQGRFQEVRSEILEADRDFKTRRPIFRIVRHALLEEHEEILRLLPLALQEQGFDLVELAEWPVLDEFRESASYRDYVSAHREAMTEVLGEDETAKIIDALQDSDDGIDSGGGDSLEGADE